MNFNSFKYCLRQSFVSLAQLLAGRGDILYLRFHRLSWAVLLLAVCPS